MTMMMKALITYISSLHEMKTQLIPLKMDGSVGKGIIRANQTQMKNQKTGSRLHEVSTLRCNRVTKSLHYISNVVCKLSYYDGLDDVNIFLDHFERDILEEHRLEALDLALRAMPTRWWGTRKDNIANWKEYRRLMRLRYGSATMWHSEKYTDKDDPREQLA